LGVSGTGGVERANLNFITSGGNTSIYSGGTTGYQISGSGLMNSNPLSFNYYNNASPITLALMNNSMMDFYFPVNVYGYTNPGNYSSSLGSQSMPNGYKFSNKLLSNNDTIAGLNIFEVRNSSGNTQSAYVGAVSNGGAGNYAPTIVFGQSTGANAYAE